MIRPSGADNSEFEFAVIGAGALGSILGAHLARAGHSVVMLVRERRARQIQADGLRITGLAEFSTSVPTLCDTSQLRSAKTLIVAMKTPGTAETLTNLRRANIGTAFSIQNGPLKNELLANVFGTQRVLGSVADTSGEMLASGEKVADFRILSCISFLHFVQQHRRKFVIAHAVDPTLLIANHEFGVHLCYFLGNETILQCALWVRLKVKFDGAQLFKL